MCKHRVSLQPDDRLWLKKLVRWGIASAAKLGHARILLLTDEGPDGPRWSDGRVVEALGVAKNTVRRVRQRFIVRGLEGCLCRSPSKQSLNRKLYDPKYKDAILAIIHSPPKDHGFNRTTWRRKDLHAALIQSGVQIGKNYLDQIIRNAGYRVRHTTTRLTSNDPRYREKVDAILTVLSHLKRDERFCSIDEFGPVAIKQRGGRRLAGPNDNLTVPQFQSSKGTLLITAALELSTNQVTHFYSTAKNTEEMIKLLGMLLLKYRRCKTLYLSWDAASWHVSKTFLAKVAEVNSIRHDLKQRTPCVRLAPLPARAQFLNVIESVFSGLSAAVIENSDYVSLDDAKIAVDRHFKDRNQYFRKHPKRAGNKIWGNERVPPTFREGQNCRNPRYR
ncbi:MAG TPA: IS630 family transposase [Phycisphaerae bacterium]|nr:IS630 family transposase [Phycisphaerae bacterium]